MVRENRIKIYSFNNAGSLTSTAGGILASQYSIHPINGTIHKVSIGSVNWGSTGSLYIRESGNPHETLAYVKGVTESVIYPSRLATLNTGATSAIFEINPVTNGILEITGSGLGAGKSGAFVDIHYI